MPPGIDAGKTLAELTGSMYQYHDSLRASHAASSPWWAWPLDLKPVWFFSERYAGLLDGPHLRHRQPRDLLAGHRRRGLRCRVRLAATQPVADARGHPLGGALVALGAHRSGHVPVPRLRQPAVRGAGPGLLPGRALARAERARLVPGPRRGRTGHPGGAAPVAAAHAALHPGRHRRSPRWERGVRLGGEPDGAAQPGRHGGPGGAGRRRGHRRRPRLALDAPRQPRPERLAPAPAPRPSPLAWSIVVALLTLGGVVAAVALLDTTTTTAVALSSDLLALVGLAVLAAACLAGAASPRPAPLRAGRARGGAALAAGLLPEPLRPAAAGGPGQPLPGPAADVELGLPVRRQHRSCRGRRPRRCRHARGGRGHGRLRRRRGAGRSALGGGSAPPAQRLASPPRTSPAALSSATAPPTPSRSGGPPGSAPR